MSMSNNQQHVFRALDPLSIALTIIITTTTTTTRSQERHSSSASNKNIIIMTAEESTTAVTISPEEAAMGDKITALGEAIKETKTAKKPQEEWDPILQEMLALKKTFQETFGKEFGKSSASSEADKKKGESQQEASDKNKAKNEAKARQKAEKEAKKVAQRLEREAREREKAERLAAVSAEADNFGDAPLVQSQQITPGKQWLPIAHVTPKLQGQVVLVRGHLQTVRAVGRGVFILVRSSLYSLQGVAFENSNSTPPISNAMIKYIAGLPLESVVDVQGVVTLPGQPIEGATQKLTELQLTHFYCICKASQALPFQMEDACRPDLVKDTDVGEYNEDAEDAAKGDDDGMIRVGQKVRADYRWLDLRTPANQSIMRIESMVGCLFRECLMDKNFVEIHTPKIIGGASEGGSEVFTLDYFGQRACLAMSPQLHKQMTAACSGFERVFETGPVFRAENSNTRRHLCEFTGLDLEMVIHEH
jgi:aspartyl-tRNA synthetase